MKNRLLPLGVMETLLKKAGAERVSEDAKAELKNYLEQRANEIGVEAVKLCKHAGRKTVNASDIRLVIQEK
jgi:DNA-binding protein